MGSVLKKHSASLLLLGSLVSSIFLGSLLTAWHVPFANPGSFAPPLTHAIATLGGASSGGSEQSTKSKVIFHFLSPRCRCSKRLADYLLSRPARAEVREFVVLLPVEEQDPPVSGPAASPAASPDRSAAKEADSLGQILPLLRRKGYRVWPDPTELNLHGSDLESSHRRHTGKIPGAPWLLIEDENGNVVYSGGYEVAPYWDARILYAVQTRLVQASLPATGCAASTKLRAGNLALRLKDLMNNP